ncbi:hypothetical protein M422DRAFT_33662 [Sphaerobolus stellatus SS14]|uniref:DUF6593 domain-containing protein n=1 Tax=Sphaerobolus stellatus (strain SS14) TaxID=990650 RepID=A0A0C9V7L6_SPHS4|nr:hypothetical protein M422DRAFT_33662 [Sphaerobolus stellatus SS14]
METLYFVQHDQFSTSVVPALDSEDVLYNIESNIQSDGSRSTDILKTSEDAEKDGLQLASVSYFDWNDTVVKFGAKSFDLNAFLRRRNLYSNSRVFVGPDGQTYKWSIRGKGLELHQADSRELIVRSHPPKEGTLFSKQRHASLEIARKHVTDDSKMLDAIIITYCIMQHKLDERLQYRYP